MSNIEIAPFGFLDFEFDKNENAAHNLSTAHGVSVAVVICG
jgi:hypothetical protein